MTHSKNKHRNSQINIFLPRWVDVNKLSDFLMSLFIIEKIFRLASTFKGLTWESHKKTSYHAARRKLITPSAGRSVEKQTHLKERMLLAYVYVRFNGRKRPDHSIIVDSVNGLHKTKCNGNWLIDEFQICFMTMPGHM